MEDPRPPEGYVLRAVTLDDASILADVFNAATLGEAGVTWTTADDILGDLQTPGFSLERDAALVEDETGAVVAGFLLLADDPQTRYAFALGLIHPEAWGRGLGSFVTALGEARAARRLESAPPGRKTVHVSRFVQNEAAAQLFRDHGYRPVRTFWSMTRDLNDGATNPGLPEGLELRPFVEARDAGAVHAALTEAFEDHWGAGTQPYEVWHHDRIANPGANFDPSLWYVAVEGDAIAGALIGAAGTGMDSEAGSVEELGVRRQWRGRGLGLALLHSAFDAFRRRGLSRSVLIVDSENPTGATRLYDRAGMTMELAWDRWEKELFA